MEMLLSQPTNNIGSPSFPPIESVNAKQTQQRISYVFSSQHYRIILGFILLHTDIMLKTPPDNKSRISMIIDSTIDELQKG